MTVVEYKAALAALSEEAFAAFRRDFGGDFPSRQRYVDDFVHHPEHERRLCQLLGLLTEADKLTTAAISSATSAKASARSARWAMMWAAFECTSSTDCPICVIVLAAA